MIIDSFDNSKPIVSLETFYGPKKNILEKCIVTFSIQIYKYLFERFDCKKVASISGCNGNIDIYSFRLNDEEIAFYLSPLGSTMASQQLMECNWITGAYKFVMFGSCGVLDQEKTKGKFIVPTSAYRDEGMSYHYAKASDYIDIKNAQKVGEIFSDLKIPFVYGKTWTTDAVLRETVDACNKRKNEGCIVVEMELAGCQAVSNFNGFELYDFLQGGDVLIEDNHLLDNLSNANHDVQKLEIALELLKRI